MTCMAIRTHLHFSDLVPRDNHPSATNGTFQSELLDRSFGGCFHCQRLGRFLIGNQRRLPIEVRRAGRRRRWWRRRRRRIAARRFSRVGRRFSRVGRRLSQRGNRHAFQTLRADHRSLPGDTRQMPMALRTGKGDFRPDSAGPAVLLGAGEGGDGWGRRRGSGLAAGHLDHMAATDASSPLARLLGSARRIERGGQRNATPRTLVVKLFGVAGHATYPGSWALQSGPWSLPKSPF